MNPKNLLELIEPDDIQRNHIRVLVTLMGTPDGKGLTTSTLDTLLDVSKRTLGRLKPTVIDRGWASVCPAPGSSDEDVWSLTPATRQQLTSSVPLDLSKLSLPAVKKAKGPDPYRFGKTTYRSVLERDVAVCLACLGVRHKVEFPYRKLVAHKSPDDWDESSIPDWKCDFIIEVSVGSTRLHGVIEVAGVKGHPDYRARLKAKELALIPIGVPFPQLNDANDLAKLRGFVELLEEQATERALSARLTSPDPTWGGAYETPTGRHVDPRGIKKRLEPGEVRPPLPSMYPEAPKNSLGPTMTPMETKEEQELRRATEALEEQRYEQRKAALAAVRAEYQAQWDDEDALASAEDRVKLLAAALEWDEQRRASQKSRSKGIGLDNPATGDDREAPWAHTDHHEEGGLEDHDGDLSDYL